MKKHRPTIKEVAQIAGVSFKTVARVANNEPLVSEKTRLAVQQAMESLGYSPNVTARQLRSNRSYLLALLTGAPADQKSSSAAMYLARAQPGAARRCTELGYNLIFVEISKENVEETVQRLDKLRIDGVIVLPPLSLRADLVAALDAHKLQHVLISSGLANGCPMIGTDEVGGAYAMTKYLTGLGHRDIAFISGGDRYASNRRFAGYLKALEDAGIPRRKAFEREGDFTYRGGEECARKLLTLKNRPSAIFAGNDETALGVMVAAARLGIHVPEELSVVGYDDAPTAMAIWPQLTTVRQPLPEMTSKAVDVLVHADLYKSTGKTELGFEIIERGSAGKPPKSVLTAHS